MNARDDTARQAFYEKIDAASCTPLWEVLHALVPPKPQTPCVPHLWRWATVWPWIQEAGTLITAEEAVRRVIVLENPGMRGQSRITRSLYAGLQMILPGEIAPVHRHSQSALRFVLYGKGAYTAVDGQQVTMSEGDFVITPSMTWHDHGNHSDEPMVWLDGLDLAIVELLDAQFAEASDAQTQQDTQRNELENLAMFGQTMAPVGFVPRSRTSPLFWYPYARTRDALAVLHRSQAPHAVWGHKLQYLNPLTGGWPMPTIGTFMQLLPNGFRGAPYRSTDATVYAVVEGSGRCTVQGKTSEFGPRDVFVCPSWMPYTLEADDEAVLFSYSDRPIQQALDVWREQFS